MAGRRRKNTVTASKKEAPKAQNTLKETTVSTDTEASKADVKKQAEDVNEKETAAAKTVEDKKVQNETEKKQTEAKAADTTVKKATTEKKTAEKKSTEKKQTASKTETTKKADAPKKRGRKPGSKNKPKEQLAPEVYLQYCGEEADQNVIIEKIKEQYVSEGHRAGNIKSLKLYLKPEDRAAYYVINERFAGKVELF